MQAKPKILFIDDDPMAMQYFAYQLRTAGADVNMEMRVKPFVEQGYDVYLIDNEFYGHSLADRLVSQIRQHSPEALVVAFSATLDRDILKRLMRLGCNKAYDKAQPDDVREAVATIIDHTRKLKTVHPYPYRWIDRWVDAVRQPFLLVRLWHERLCRHESLLNRVK